MEISVETVLNMIEAKITECENALEMQHMSKDFYKKQRVRLDTFLEMRATIEQFALEQSF